MARITRIKSTGTRPDLSREIGGGRGRAIADRHQAVMSHVEIDPLHDDFHAIVVVGSLARRGRDDGIDAGDTGRGIGDVRLAIAIAAYENGR